MNINDLTLDNLFTPDNGKTVWRLIGFCMEPTCTLRNLETGEIENFGIGGLTSKSFVPLKIGDK